MPYVISASASLISRRSLAKSGLYFVSALCAGLAIGWACWGGTEQHWPLAFAILLPICWGLCTSHMQAWALSLGYFMSGARGLPGGVAVFFGEGAPQWLGVAMWLSACILLSTPYALFWSSSPSRRAAGFVAALLATTIPPLGIVGWVNPLSAAGVLFPGGAWLGLLASVMLFYFLACGRFIVLIPAIVIALSANFAAKGFERPQPPGWEGRETNFANLWSAGSNYASQLLSSMERAQWLVTIIEKLPPGQTLVLPETLLGRFDGVIQGMLEEAERNLLAKDSRVLVGAELANGYGGYKNALIVLGAASGQDRFAKQSLPVPISMWKPWARDGAEADFLGRGNTIKVGQLRVAVSVCYEQLVTVSLLRVMLEKPDVIAAVSNVWWASSTNIPQIQQQSISAFARLFNVPVVVARNI